MDAQEIKTAVAHQDAARAAAEAPFVNLADPARALGPDGRPAVSRRAPIWDGRPRRAVERLALAAQPPRQRPRRDRADPQPDRRGARRAVRPGQVPRRHHAVLHQPDRPERPQRPDPPPGHPDSAASTQAFTAMMEDSLAEDRHSPVPGPRPPLPGPRPDAGHDPVRVLLPLLHAVADRRRPDPELQQPRPRGPARVPAPDPAGPRRPHLRRRRPDPRAEAVREDPARPARDPAHRDHPDRLAGAGLPAAAHRRRAVRDAREVPPALDQPPLQPPQRDHARRSRARSTS